MRKKKREVAIVGVGQTVHTSKRDDVNEPELVAEAVRKALDHAGLAIDDIDATVHGNMELFEGVHQPDMWQSLGFGGYLKSGIRVTTGGTTGSTIACVADNMVASGLHDVVLVVGMEKQDEGHTTTGITAMADPLWGRALQTGAITGATAQLLINKFGERAIKAAARYRVIMNENAKLNPHAHLKLDIDEENVMNSFPLASELRYLHMCPQSCGACAVIMAAEGVAEEMTDKPVWIVDHETVHREETFNLFKVEGEIRSTHEEAARRLYERNGIVDALGQLDLFEMYDPSAWWGLDWLQRFLLLPEGKNIELVEDGEISRYGSFPVNPSGGVVSTNPIGASGLLRVAEAALQMRGDAGPHQVPKEVNRAIASGFGGTYWSVLLLLDREKPQR